MLLFLSYADEDSKIAREIAEWLRREDVSVCASRDDSRPSGLTTTDPECAIQQADAFLALLSPNSLTSASCRRERELALHLEQRSRENRAGIDFVRGLQIRDTPYHQAGSLRSLPWFDLTGQAAKHRAIHDLASKFAPPGNSAPSNNHTMGSDGGGQTRPPSPHFRNRESELDEVFDGVTKEDGEHFWLLIAPPQLGKSWLLDQIADRVERRWRGRWVIKLVDARELRPEIVGDADAILRMLFGLEPQDNPEPTDVQGIATSISRHDRFHLCLLDSAELLNDSTVRRLRQHLSEVNAGITEARNPGARLAMVVASRRDREWKGVTPAPRLQIRRLTEFSVGVIQEALEKLAENMGRFIAPDELHQHAVRVHQLSEGLPALLAECLDWIRAQNWRGLQRLSDQSTFNQIARPYIENVLLSPSSLRGSGSMPTDEHQEAIRQALRVLSPYRFFTQSHLSRLTESGELPGALFRLGWSIEDLWAAVSGTDLLFRPQREPWLEMYAPIRRLLCRHWYPSEASRGQANREACVFLRPFAIGQSGSDQSVVLVECLWHEAQALILERSAELEERLIVLARELSARLTSNLTFNEANLRDHAVACLMDDQELAEAVSSVPRLLDRLADAVLRPT